MANLVEKLAQSMSGLGIKASYGDPVTIDGIEIVPVAWVQYGFGGGSDGRTTDDGGEGAGGGGGGVSIPLGVYVGGPVGPVFRPNIIVLLTTLIPVLWVGGRALALVIKALKK
ncbi:MAG: hypothetical protein H7146_11025 [Burkholderiaceae bacterium]|nr:hypothetical protein [Microbacteriaceae bacterium]